MVGDIQALENHDDLDPEVSAQLVQTSAQASFPLDALEIRVRGLNAKEVFMPKNGEDFKNSWSQMEQSSCDQVFRNTTSIQDQPARSEEHGDDSRRVGRVSTVRHHYGWRRRPTRFLVDRKESEHMYRHHVEPRVKLYVVPNTTAIH